MTDVDMARFWDERAREDAEFFVDDRGFRGEQFWQGGEEVLTAFADQLGVAFESSDAVVEIGCGVGRVTRAIASRAGSVVALDVSGEMLARAQELNPELENVRWILGDGTSLEGVEDGSADAVFSHVVFQHVPDPAITLGYVREMGRVLRPGGWAAFQVSNDPGIHRPRLRARLRAALGRGPRGQQHAAWLGSAVDLDELHATAGAAGLRVDRTSGEATQFCLVRLVRA